MVEKTSERVLKKRGRKKIEPEANKYYIKGKTYEIVKTILKSDDILTIKGFRDSISKQVIPQILSEIKEFLGIKYLGIEEAYKESLTKEEIRIIKEFIAKATPDPRDCLPQKKAELETPKPDLQETALIPMAVSPKAEENDLFKKEIEMEDIRSFRFPFLAKVKNNSEILKNTKEGPITFSGIKNGDILNLQGPFPMKGSDKVWLCATLQSNPKDRLLVGHDCLLRM